MGTGGQIELASLEIKLALCWSLWIHLGTVIFCILEGSSNFLFCASSLQGKYSVLQNTVVTTQCKMNINNLLAWTKMDAAKPVLTDDD